MLLLGGFVPGRKKQTVEICPQSEIVEIGAAGKDDFGLPEASSLNYIFPLIRGNKFVEDNVSFRPTDYDEAFSYNKKGSAIESV